MFESNHMIDFVAIDGKGFGEQTVLTGVGCSLSNQTAQGRRNVVAHQTLALNIALNISVGSDFEQTHQRIELFVEV